MGSCCNKLTHGEGGGSFGRPLPRFSKWLHIKDQALACKKDITAIPA